MRALVVVAVLAVAAASAPAASRPMFELPYDLVVASDGTLLFSDRSRVLALDPAGGRVRVHASIPRTKEIAGLAQLRDGSLVVADLASETLWRVRRGAKPSRIATVPAPVDVLADPSGRVVWVASIAAGAGLLRVELVSGDVTTFAPLDRPHGLDRERDGDLVVHDGRRVSRVDATGKVTRVANVDAFKLAVAPEGSIYGAVGSPSGGRVVRIARDGRVTPVAGTGRLGTHRDGQALRAPMLPSALAIGPRRTLYIAQIEPVPAIRRLDLRTGRITTLARSR